MKLGVNIDHIATLREARGINEPDPLEAVFIAKRAGAYQITIHLREDRRHIHDDDVLKIANSSFLPLNVETSINENIIKYLLKIAPHRITLVPEKRKELTTEGGLNIKNNSSTIQKIIDDFHKVGTEVSLFIDCNCVEQCAKLGADMVEIHTGLYANLHLMLFSNLPRTHNTINELSKLRLELQEGLNNSLIDIQEAAKIAKELKLEVAAGHGLNYNNIEPILNIEEITELNIGHSIISRAIFTGLEQAIKDMLTIINSKQ
ncbi:MULTISPECIES: pyridoxine 5'-phosphate synthase [Helicobacter]|uniref:Pyridoxine 5'-phosphate synthase n=1 Tax=Helicobacter ibis TaxID=2962633 RepID=A0ABT4VFM2_9HELI|nr:MULTISPECIES: pyridoxine 5'-phosphate synthase [Helicobacter]MDA3967786.1 pyridoxine 5'-phosphate synthase [Helicobacter sp. WB40]MDA3969501.1 pyridoxine 5'-phosphate synthase [Helicobacter ibis]